LKKNTEWNGRPVRWPFWHDNRTRWSWATYSQGTRHECRM
jgi:hypothetical protein